MVARGGGAVGHQAAKQVQAAVPKQGQGGRVPA